MIGLKKTAPKQKAQTRRLPRTSSALQWRIVTFSSSWHELTNGSRWLSFLDNILSVTCLYNYMALCRILQLTWVGRGTWLHSSHLARFLNVQLLAGGEEDAEADEEDEHRRLQAQLCNQNQSLISCWCKSSYADQNPDMLISQFVHLIHQSHLVQSKTLLPILFLLAAFSLYCSDQGYMEICGETNLVWKEKHKYKW